jgi:DNA-binding MarR family transcriptional regulator
MAEKVDRDSLSQQYDKMDERPWRYLTVVIKKWEKEVGEVLESFEVTRVQLEFLMCVSKFATEGRPATQKDLAAALGRAKNTASEAFSNLEKKGYIVRSPGDADLREKHVVLTEKGWHLVEKTFHEVTLVDQRLFPDERDNEELIKLLKKYL